jgi:hypothetical protein
MCMKPLCDSSTRLLDEQRGPVFKMIPDTLVAMTHTTAVSVNVEGPVFPCNFHWVRRCSRSMYLPAEHEDSIVMGELLEEVGRGKNVVALRQV